jgi:hypothetical protein
MARCASLLIAAAILAALPSLRASAAPTEVKVTYSSDEMATSPAGNVNFHGQFSNETLTIHAEGLPTHDFLEITCDLLILHTWDGSVLPESQPRGAEPNGPDYLRLGLRNGPTLLYTTFSNLPDEPGWLRESLFQNYPSQVPGDRLPCQTGAAATGTLGYQFPWGKIPSTAPMDATYKLKFIVPHSDSDAAIEFTGMGLQNIMDESWGVTNVKVKVLAAADVKKPDAFDITNAFRDALDPKAKNQPEAFNLLVRGMDTTEDWLAKNVDPVKLDGPKIAKLVKDLAAGDKDVDIRSSAERQLHAMGPIVEPYLRDARKTADGELRFRIDRVLKYLGVHTIEDANLRRVLLATRVLEIIGTPRALDVRRTLTEQR